MKRRLIFCLTICLLQTNSWAEDWSYTLRPGDDIWSIAQQFTGSGKRAVAIAQHNNVADPKLIKPGQRINIPINWLAFAPSSATIAETTNNVLIQRATRGLQNNTRQRAAVGDTLHMGDRLITSDGSALVQFADGSTLSVAPESHILFNKLTAFGPAGMVDTHLRFAYGHGKARVQPQNRGNRFRIQTPEGVAAVRGTEFRVGHNVDAAVAVTNTETLEGEVAFNKDTDSTLLSRGFGIVASQAGVVKEALLAAPQWTNQLPTTQAEEIISWQPVEGAHHYVATWLSQANPNIIFKQSNSTTTHISVDVPQGAYQLTVRAVSNAGIEGFDNRRKLQVQALAPLLKTVSSQHGGPVQFDWQYARPDSTFNLTISDADGQLQHQLQTREQSASMELSPGSYRWQVQAQNSAASAPQSFTLRPHSPDGIELTQNRQEVTLRWLADPAVDRYTLRVIPTSTVASTGAAHPQTYDVSGGHHQLSNMAFGTYTLELTAIQGGVSSEPSLQKLYIQRRPWWLLLLVIPLLSL